MKYKCNDCDWIGYGLVSDGKRDCESVCPHCGSYSVKEIKEQSKYDNFSDTEGDMYSIDDYYDDFGSGIA